jgi:hypothetical protein
MNTISSVLFRQYNRLKYFLPSRTDNAFQQWLKKGVTFISTDYIIPSEMCAMVNVILDAKNQSFKLCAVDGVDVVMKEKILYIN